MQLGVSSAYLRRVRREGQAVSDLLQVEGLLLRQDAEHLCRLKVFVLALIWQKSHLVAS